MATDVLMLNNTPFFEKIRESLPPNKQLTQNLMDCKDDLLYAWDSIDASLLVLNWRMVQLKGFDEIHYQTLIPSFTIHFTVERIKCSNEGSSIAIFGPKGICILELPRRWGANGHFMDGKTKITCRSYNLDSRFFNNNPQTEIRQLRWHPDSPTDSNFLVLLSDNTIRVYDNAQLRHVWQVGPIPIKSESINSSAISTVEVLGEISVDFDIAPAVKSNFSATSSNLTESSTILNESHLSKKIASKGKQIEWPLVILRENGNIYILMAGLDSIRPRLQGPVTMTPQTSHNYGLESCAILVIPSLPTTLVIAESTGNLHHALLLEAEFKEDSFNEVDSTISIHPSEWTVHVLETVKLELGLPKKDSKGAFNCPIHLKRDFINELRYFAYHNTGLHAVTVNFISELQRYLENQVSSDFFLSTSSQAEYLVCTKIDNSNRVNAIIGFVILQMPSVLVLLLGSGQVINLKLILDPKLLSNESFTKLSIGSNSNVKHNEETGSHFVDHIKNILARSVSQPIISTDKTVTPTPKECYELLTQAIDVFNTQYLERHKLVRDEFTKHIKTLHLRKEQQQHEIEDLEHEREIVRERAHKLAERFEEICEKQEIFNKKIQNFLRQINSCIPVNTNFEKGFMQEVGQINKATKDMQADILKTQESINKQCFHISNYTQKNKSKTFDLPEKQERTIKEIIIQLNEEIDSQIKEVKRIKKIVGI